MENIEFACNNCYYSQLNTLTNLYECKDQFSMFCCADMFWYAYLRACVKFAEFDPYNDNVQQEIKRSLDFFALSEIKDNIGVHTILNYDLFKDCPFIIKNAYIKLTVQKPRKDLFVQLYSCYVAQRTLLEDVKNKIISCGETPIPTNIALITCGICYVNKIQIVYSCGHAVCSECFPRILCKCPFCRLHTTYLTQIFL
jgi:hypothetical protein